MADEQASTLAFLQNFYTDVTLYMPFEAHERKPGRVATEAAPPPVAASVVAALPVVVATPPALAAAAAVPGKLPSLAGLGEPAAPVAVPVVPAAAVPAPPVLAPVTPAPLAPPVAAPAAPQVPQVPPYMLTTFNTLGNNPQGVVLLVRLPPEQFTKLPRNVFLNKLLQAINLVMADVVLVNLDGLYPVALQNLRKEVAATHILAFGKNLLDVAVRTTQIYEPVQFPSVGLSYLAGAEIELIEYDVSLKRRLWGGLKSMFLS